MGIKAEFWDIRVSNVEKIFRKKERYFKPLSMYKPSGGGRERERDKRWRPNLGDSMALW